MKQQQPPVAHRCSEDSPVALERRNRFLLLDALLHRPSVLRLEKGRLLQSAFLRGRRCAHGGGDAA